MGEAARENGQAKQEQRGRALPTLVAGLIVNQDGPNVSLEWADAPGGGR